MTCDCLCVNVCHYVSIRQYTSVYVSICEDLEELETCDVPSKHRTTEHGGREGGQERVTLSYQEVTVCFSPTIDRQRFSVVIV